jgi:hypothetical protein
LHLVAVRPFRLVYLPTTLDALRHRVADGAMSFMLHPSLIAQFSMSRWLLTDGLNAFKTRLNDQTTTPVIISRCQFPSQDLTQK